MPLVQPGYGAEDAAGTSTRAVASEAQRFAALWRRHVASPPAVDGATVYADLCDRYSAPYRQFHNLDHIRDCLRRFDEVAPMLHDRDAVELALWFHDAVYDVGACTNERRSAELFLGLTGGVRFLFRHHVCGLIMATRHARLIQGHDRSYMVDIDLSGFGAPWEEFMRNGALLRAESVHQTDDQYLAAQVIFLGRLQQRPRFFFTEYFRDRYETVARDNLARILADLAHRGYRPATL